MNFGFYLNFFSIILGKNFKLVGKLMSTALGNLFAASNIVIGIGIAAYGGIEYSCSNTLRLKKNERLLYEKNTRRLMLAGIAYSIFSAQFMNLEALQNLRLSTRRFCPSVLPMDMESPPITVVAKSHNTYTANVKSADSGPLK